MDPSLISKPEERKVVAYLDGPRQTWGTLVAGKISPASALPSAPPNISELIEDPAHHDWIDAVGNTEPHLRIDEVVLLPPCRVPAPEILALGLNYRAHVSETRHSNGVPDSQILPILFGKAGTTVVGPDDAIQLDPDLSHQVDWEVELAIIVGRGGIDIAADAALQHVFGFTVANDISARDIQMANGGQWYLGKSFDTFCPIGPAVALPHTLDANDLEILLRVNGVEKQRARTSDLIVSIPQIVAYASRRRTLLPGSIILTGTPGGVGFTRRPPEFLIAGDVVEAEIEGIGILRNPVTDRRELRG